jgi:hypothetical protein
MLVRKQSFLVQFLISAALLAATEVLNQLGLLPGTKWVFAPGFPLGITNDWLRIAVLAIPEGLFIVLVNYIMYQLYRRRLKLG